MKEFMFGLVAVCCITQALCLISKCIWVRLLPAMIVVVSMLYHVVMTFVASNAWYLVFAALHIPILGILGLVWLVCGVHRGARLHQSEKN